MPPSILIIGNGEYVTGFTAQGAANSDKSTGVVGLVALDLRRRGKVNRIGMCGTDGRKLPAIGATCSAFSARCILALIQA